MSFDSPVTLEPPMRYEGGDTIVTSIQGVVDSLGSDMQSLDDHSQFEIIQIINRLKPGIPDKLTTLEEVKVYEDALLVFKKPMLDGIEASNIQSLEVKNQIKSLLDTCLQDGFELCEYKRQELGGSATKLTV